MPIASLEIYTACYNCGAMVHRDYITCGGCPYCGFPIVHDLPISEKTKVVENEQLQTT